MEGGGRERGQAPKSVTEALLERVAEAMDLDHGQHTLELVFVDGELRRWFAHTGERASGALGRYDERVRDLVRYDDKLRDLLLA